MSSGPKIDDDVVRWSAPRSDLASRPLLVLLHGYGSNEDDLFGLLPFLPDKAVIASIRAPWSLGFGYAWYPLQGPALRAPNPEAVDAAVDAVVAWLDSLSAMGPIGLLGFSQGGAMSLQLLRERPQQFAFAVQLSGFVIDRESKGDHELAIRRPPVFWGRGDHDDVISDERIARTAAWLPSHSTLESMVYDTGHSITQQELVDVSTFIESQF